MGEISVREKYKNVNFLRGQSREVEREEGRERRVGEKVKQEFSVP